MNMQFAYVKWSMLLLVFWFIVFYFLKTQRKKMWYMSLGTAPLGLSEPLFYPEYWYPPTLFDLGENTGFDIESIIFCFAIGGLASSLCELGVRKNLRHMPGCLSHTKRHRFHRLALTCPIWVFLLLEWLTSVNVIYTASLSLLAGSVACILCRPDLSVKTLKGGVAFFLFYFLFFATMIWMHPNFVDQYWNVDELIGYRLLGVPLEELLFASTLGLMWSCFYEHTNWLRGGKKVNRSKLLLSEPRVH